MTVPTGNLADDDNCDVLFTESGVVLNQQGKSLKVENLNHPEITFSVINLDPPPLPVDRQIEGLKRLELRIPAYLANDNQIDIRVKLSK